MAQLSQPGVFAGQDICWEDDLLVSGMRASVKRVAGRLRIVDRRNFAWGFASQGASSITNLGLSLLAGRLLGPSSLGAIFVGFSVYLLAMGFLRSLITRSSHGCDRFSR